MAAGVILSFSPNLAKCVIGPRIEKYFATCFAHVKFITSVGLLRLPQNLPGAPRYGTGWPQ